MHDIKPIRVFLEVAAQASFAGAARNLGMTPASVTRIIARLESQLNKQLLLRTTRQVSLTSAGAAIAAQYAPLIEALDRVTSDVVAGASPGMGRLRLNVPLSLGLRLMPSLTADFQNAFPGVALDIALTDSLVDIIEADCDLAIRISGPPSTSSTIWRKVCAVPRHIIASPALLASTGRPETPDDLDPKRCFSYSAQGAAETWALQRGATRRPFRAGTHLVSNNGDYLLARVCDGSGMALLPDFICAEQQAAGAVEQVLPDWLPDPLWLTLYYPPYDALPPLVATFSEFFEDYMRSNESRGMAPLLP